jgi:hypothetical protein
MSSEPDLRWTEAEALRQVILSSCTDDEVLAWVQEHARPTTAVEKHT